MNDESQEEQTRVFFPASCKQFQITLNHSTTPGEPPIQLGDPPFKEIPTSHVSLVPPPSVAQQSSQPNAVKLQTSSSQASRAAGPSLSGHCAPPGIAIREAILREPWDMLRRRAAHTMGKEHQHHRLSPAKSPPSREAPSAATSCPRQRAVFLYYLGLSTTKTGQGD